MKYVSALRPPKPLVSPALRNSARGRPCTLRLPGCDGGGETTVLAHVRMFGNAGVGQKPSDIFAVFACAHCHDGLDGRNRWRPEPVDILRALIETQTAWLTEGFLVAKGGKPPR